MRAGGDFPTGQEAKKMNTAAVVVIICTISFTAPFARAQEEQPDPGTGALVTETVNARLSERVEELQAELRETKRDFDEVRAKLRTAMRENEQFKDEIAALKAERDPADKLVLPSGPLEPVDVDQLEQQLKALKEELGSLADGSG
jgi:hypothetical protein